MVSFAFFQEEHLLLGTLPSSLIALTGALSSSLIPLTGALPSSLIHITGALRLDHTGDLRPSDPQTNPHPKSPRSPDKPSSQILDPTLRSREMLIAFP